MRGEIEHLGKTYLKTVWKLQLPVTITCYQNNGDCTD